MTDSTFFTPPKDLVNEGILLPGYCWTLRQIRGQDKEVRYHPLIQETIYQQLEEDHMEDKIEWVFYVGVYERFVGKTPPDEDSYQDLLALMSFPRIHGPNWDNRFIIFMEYMEASLQEYHELEYQQSNPYKSRGLNPQDF